MRKAPLRQRAGCWAAPGRTAPILAVLALSGAAAGQTPQGTAFSYQGRLTDGGSPASGTYDFRFTLYDAATGGTQVGPQVTRDDVLVATGLFTVALDFGAGAFAGSARFLEVAVRPGASGGAYTVLGARQELTPAPATLYSAASPWTGVSAKPPGFADDVDDDVLGGLSCASGQVAKWSGTAWACAPDEDSGGTVTSVTASAPLSSSGGATPNLTLSGVVPVNLGGTGTGTALSGVVLGGNPLSGLSASGAGQLLRRDGANSAYEFVSPSGGGSPVGSGRSLLTGSSLLGGGDLSADRTLSLNPANANTWAATQTFAPVSDVSGALVRQSSAASPTADVFAVQDAAGSTSFLRVTSAGALSWSGTASGSISGSAASAVDFTGSLSGDVSGTQSATSVDRLRGRAVASTAPTSGQVLKWSGTAWTPSADSTGGSGTVTQVATGSGLTGGPITVSGTVAVATGGITTTLLADSAVTSAKIADGAVGAAQINTAQVQVRIAGSCPLGQYLRGINPDGSVVCEPLLTPLLIATVELSADNSICAPGYFSSIAVPADGLPVVSYWDRIALALKVAKCGDAACTSGNTRTLVDDQPVNEVGRYTSIAVGADELPVISYHASTIGALKVAKCGNPACSAGNTLTVVDDPANDVGEYTSIAIGADGLPVISYYDHTAFALKVAKCGDAACSTGNTLTVVDDPANDVGAYTSIAIGADGLPVISYYDATAFALKVAKCGDAACSAGNTLTTVDDQPVNDVGAYTSIAIGADGLPVISYFAATIGALKVAKCGNAACSAGNTLTVVDSPTNDVGYGTSIAIGSDGLPLVSYYDRAARSLKVAKCGNGACAANNTITTLDTGAAMGCSSGALSTATALGSDGLPVISFHDLNDVTDEMRLKVAKCGTRSCQ